MSSANPANLPSTLLADLQSLIDASRGRLATVVNQEITLLYWQVGHRIQVEILGNQRADYGTQVVKELADSLKPLYGNGFDKKNLYRMIQFAKRFPENEIVVTLSRQLSWSHFVAILPIEQPLARTYYAEMCRVERWSVRTLRQKIDSMLFERTAISKKPDELIETELEALQNKDQLTPSLVFRDPYVLDFLELKDTYSERDLETAILRELEAFILELGTDFSFVARQKRIVVDGDDFYIDLLFYHRGLRRLIAIELKLGQFKPADKGQVELYLRWLNKHERREGEESPLGLILCAGKRQEMIELLELEATGIHVAEYYTTLPPQEVLVAKLQQALQRAREQQRQLPDGLGDMDEEK
jgi:predicted nuclease of restriction endonuclease-like (RecB) superfamily